VRVKVRVRARFLGNNNNRFFFLAEDGDFWEVRGLVLGFRVRISGLKVWVRVQVKVKG
jgi:hypothetical protein